MANKSAILDKIVRNMGQRGYASAVVRNGDVVEVTKTGGDVITVSYIDKEGDAPQIGVGIADSISGTNVLGIGRAGAGSLRLKGAAAESTIAAIIDTDEAIVLFAELAGFANDIVIEDGGSTTEIIRIAGQSDILGLGE